MFSAFTIIMCWIIDLSLTINVFNSLILFIREARVGYYREGLILATKYFMWGLVAVILEISLISFIFFGGSIKTFACLYSEYSGYSLNKIINSLPVGETLRKPVRWIVNGGVDASKSIIGCGESNGNKKHSENEHVLEYDILSVEESSAFDVDFKDDAIFDQKKGKLNFEFRIENRKDLFYNLDYLSRKTNQEIIVKPKSSFPEEDNSYTNVSIGAKDTSEIKNIRFFANLDRGFVTVTPRKKTDNPLLEAGIVSFYSILPGGKIFLNDYYPSNLAAIYNVTDIFSRTILDVEFDPDFTYMFFSVYTVFGEKATKSLLGKTTGGKIFSIISNGKSGYDLMIDVNGFLKDSDLWTVVSVFSGACQLIVDNKVAKNKVIDIIRSKFGSKIAAKLSKIITDLVAKNVILLWSRVFTLAPKSIDIYTTLESEESIFKFEKKNGFDFFGIF